MKERYGLHVRVVEPLIPPDDLWQNDPLAPRDAQGRAARVALQGKQAWLTGLRRDEASTRDDVPIVSLDVGLGS